jgi:hypothetical protein
MLCSAGRAARRTLAKGDRLDAEAGKRACAGGDELPISRGGVRQAIGVHKLIADKPARWSFSPRRKRFKRLHRHGGRKLPSITLFLSTVPKYVRAMCPPDS